MFALSLAVGFSVTDGAQKSTCITAKPRAAGEKPATAPGPQARPAILENIASRSHDDPQ